MKYMCGCGCGCSVEGRGGGVVLVWLGWIWFRKKVLVVGWLVRYSDCLSGLSGWFN